MDWPNPSGLPEQNDQSEEDAFGNWKLAAATLLTRRRLFGTVAATAGTLAGLSLDGFQAGSALAIGSLRGASSALETDSSTLVVATHRTPSDLDPHSAYDAGSRIVLKGLFETLIRVGPDSTDRYEPSLAESWEPNADRSVWTFHL